MSELARRQQYLQGVSKSGTKPPSQQPASAKPSEKCGEAPTRSCYNCGSTDHLARQCKKPKTESSGYSRRPNQSTDATAKGIKSKVNPLDILFSDSDEESSDIKTVRIHDKGSKPRKVAVDVQGVPAVGMIDSGADITIMGTALFKKVASVARLKKSSFEKPDKTPYTYNNQPFSLDGKLKLDITFNDCTMCTPVYIKMDRCYSPKAFATNWALSHIIQMLELTHLGLRGRHQGPMYLLYGSS